MPTVLIIEADHLVLTSMARLLKHHGWGVVTARDARDAAGMYDLAEVVLTHWGRTGATGQRVLDESPLPVVVWSGGIDAPEGSLVKPCGWAQIANALKMAIRDWFEGAVFAVVEELDGIEQLAESARFDAGRQDFKPALAGLNGVIRQATEALKVAEVAKKRIENAGNSAG